MKNKLIASLMVALPLMVASTSSLAHTECTGMITAIWTGDSGAIQIIMTGGISWSIPPTDPNQKNILAMASFAMGMGKQITVRFAADGAACADAPSRNDVLGMFVFQ